MGMMVIEGYLPHIGMMVIEGYLPHLGVMVFEGYLPHIGMMVIIVMSYGPFTLKFVPFSKEACRFGQ